MFRNYGIKSSATFFLIRLFYFYGQRKMSCLMNYNNYIQIRAAIFIFVHKLSTTFMVEKPLNELIYEWYSFSPLRKGIFKENRTLSEVEVSYLTGDCILQFRSGSNRSDFSECALF